MYFGTPKAPIKLLKISFLQLKMLSWARKSPAVVPRKSKYLLLVILPPMRGTMKSLGVALLALSTFTFGQGTGQQQTQPFQSKQVPRTAIAVSNTPTPDDMYCSGFITTEKVSESRYIVGGWFSPDQAHFAGATDYVYIHGSSGLKAGDKLHILRRVKAPNHYERYSGEKGAIRQV